MTDSNSVLSSESNEPHRTESPGENTVWQTFFSLTGGSIYYCASALMIIFGIAKILGPTLANVEVLSSEAIASIVTLNVYEIALLGVLLLIVIWRNVVDDAISLVVLVAIFISASGVALTSVANIGPGIAKTIGITCAGLGVVQITLLRKGIKIPFRRPSFAGLVLILLWNFLIGTQLAITKTSFAAQIGRDLTCRYGWLFLIAGGLLVLIDGMLAQARNLSDRRNRTPFLQSAPMMIIFGMLLLGTMVAHEYAASYIMDINFSTGDFMPLFAIFCMLGLELCRILGKRQGTAELFPAILPLCAMSVALASRSMPPASALWADLLWHPAVVLGLTGTAVFIHGLRTKNRNLLMVAAAYAIGVAITIRYIPGADFVPQWKIPMAVMVLAIYVSGLIKRNFAHCFTAVAIAATGAYFTGSLDIFRQLFGIEDQTSAILFMGLAGTVTTLIFGRNSPKAATIVSSLALMYGVFLASSSTLRPADILIYSCLAGLAVLTFKRTGSIPAAALIGLPLLNRIWMLFTLLGSWRYVLAGFVLLVVGAIMSLRKGDRKPEPLDPVDTESINNGPEE